MQSHLIQKERSIHEIVDVCVLLGAFFGITGTYWDIQYHIDVGRDSFWIPPHLMVYFGVLLVLCGMILALFLARDFAHHLTTKRLWKAMWLILFGSFTQLIAAPIDDFWHRLYGLDVTVWSPPHLLLIFAGVLITLGLIYFQRLYMHIAHVDRARKLIPDEIKLELMFAIALVGLNIILAEFEFFRTIPLYHISHVRPHWMYLFGLTIECAFLFALAKRLIQQRWVATRIALWYVLIRSAISFILSQHGSWPIYPPLVIIAAIAFDLLFSPKVKGIIATACVFSLVFYATQSMMYAALNIPEYVPQSIAEPLGTMVVAALIMLSATGIGTRMLAQVDGT